MKIAVLGAGNIGGSLAKKWAKAGHSICFGLRDPGKPYVQELVKSLGSAASAASIAETIDFGEIVLFAIPGPSMDETIAANAKALDGKIIIDSANKMGAAALNSMATFVKQTPKARPYRAFNTYGWEVFDNATYPDGPADLFFCGPNGDSRAPVEALISAVGLHPVYLGGVDQADMVDSVLRLWITLAISQKKGRSVTFKVVTR
jgi:8-hydroxy-5-deazaflavin:NADPH oxidoreductase